MKRLTVCCDGTWQKLASSCPTNVIKIAQAVKNTADDGVAQIVFYDEGIGTENFANKIAGGAFGWGLDKNIRDAYRFLCLNYSPGDEIYLFGFSRGAYTVRSLAGMIYCAGLLNRSAIRSAPAAYELYRDRSIKPSHQQALHFRKTHGERVPITLLACWDTVGSLGVPDQIPWLPINEWINGKYKFHDTTLNPMVRNAFHAVAIDELRKVFDVTLMNKNPDTPDQVLKQAWFPGDHSCIGGGCEENCGLSDGSLSWMIKQIKDQNLGLDLDAARIPTGLKPDHSIDFDNCPSGFYRLTGKKERDLTCSFEDLHESVKKRWRDRRDYRPVNLKKKFGYMLENLL
ncbi:MAG: DUF2235 domain-containing protein [Tangfeifania sp.]